jgi:alcohol dehydrogenase (cytochrome c)
LCPSWLGGNNYWSASRSRRTKLLYIPSVVLQRSHPDPDIAKRHGSILGRQVEPTTDIIVVDPFTGEVKKKTRKPYLNCSSSHDGRRRLRLNDGSFVAYDDSPRTALGNQCRAGFNAPPMTFEVGGKQYVAILTGLGRNAKAALVNTPELREMRNQTMLFVFGL